MRRPRVGTSTAYIWCCGQGQTPMLLLPQKAEEIRQTYKCTKERILSRCITPWSTQDHKKLLRVVNIAQSITQASSPPFHLQFTLLWWNTRIIQTLVCFPSLAFLMKGDGSGPVTVSTNAAWPVELFHHFCFYFSLCTDQLSKRLEYKGWFGILKRCKLNEQSRSITQWLHDQAPGSPVQVNCSLMGQHVGLFIGINCSLGPGKKLDFLIIWFDSLGALISMQKGNSDKLEHEIGTPQIADCLYWSCAALSWSTDLQPPESSLCKDHNTQSILPKSKNRE